VLARGGEAFYLLALSFFLHSLRIKKLSIIRFDHSLLSSSRIIGVFKWLSSQPADINIRKISTKWID